MTCGIAIPTCLWHTQTSARRTKSDLPTATAEKCRAWYSKKPYQVSYAAKVIVLFMLSRAYQGLKASNFQTLDRELVFTHER